MDPTSRPATCSVICRPSSACAPDHPLRAIRRMTDEVLASCRRGSTRCTRTSGRPSIPPEQLLRALLLQALYTVRSERLLMEEIDYSILFRWFVGLAMDEPIWSPTTFTKNRDRLLRGRHRRARSSMPSSARRATAGLLSDEHFTVDGTLLEAWASLKSFRRKDAGPTPPPDDPGNPTVNFHGESRRNDTHQSTTDPDARLSRKGHGQEAKLGVRGPRADGQSPRPGGECLRHRRRPAPPNARPPLLLLGAARRTAAPSAATRATTSRSFVAGVRALGVTPHVAQKVKGSAIDGRTTRHAGLCHQSTETETDRAGLRLDEDRRRPAQAAASRRRAASIGS